MAKIKRKDSSDRKAQTKRNKIRKIEKELKKNPFNELLKRALDKWR